MQEFLSEECNQSEKTNIRLLTGQSPYRLSFSLPYQAPYDWDRVLGFLGGRAIPDVETVEDGRYCRTVAIRKNGKVVSGWICVFQGQVDPRNPGDTLHVTFPPSLLPVQAELRLRLRHQFDLDCDPLAVAKILDSMNLLKPGMFTPGTRVPGCFDAFEMSVRAILGQQITVKAARTLATRFASGLGSPVSTPFPALTLAFPDTACVLAIPEPIADTLGPMGITGQRARSVHVLAGQLEAGKLNLTPNSNPDEAIEALLRLPGIGPWTAQYICLRALSWRDAFPHTDYGVKKALGDPSPKEILSMSEAWKPWRSYATLSLWHSLA